MTEWLVRAPSDIGDELEALARERGLPTNQLLSTLAVELVRSRSVEQFLPKPLRPASGVDLQAIADTYKPVVYRIAVELSNAECLSSVELADIVGIHIGNINRHLTKLRAAGYVESRNGRHYLVEPQEAAA